MKQLIAILFLLFSSCAYSQRITDNNTRVGYLEVRANGMFHLPEDTVLSPSVNANLCQQVAKKNGIVYTYDCILHKWKPIASDATVVDSGRISHDTIYLRKTTGGEIVIPIGLIDSLAVQDLQRVTERGNTTDQELILDAGAILGQTKNNVAEDSLLTTSVVGRVKMVAKNSITSAYTPLTRALTVGTGMTGGGDFSADRSVGLDYSYLDDRYLSGYKQRAAVRVATIANITLSAPQTIDGVSAIAGDRVLVKNQTTGSQNGIYIVAAGAWSRSTDFDQAIPGEIEQGSQIFVQEGTNNNKTGWSLATSGAITVGTTTLTFIQYAGANSYAAGTGLALAGNTFSALNTTALWNANKLQGYGVATTAPISSQLLRYDGTNWAPWTANFLTGNQTITATGDATGSGTTSIPLTLKNTGTAGTYTKVTTDAQGRVTVGTNPTTLAGYGITDAAPSNIGLPGVLANGNAANNNITLGANGNAGQYIFSTIRNISGVNYTGAFAVGLPGDAVITASNGTVATNKNLYVPTAGTTIQYSPNNGVDKYDIWHSDNHPAGTAMSVGPLSGSLVISKLTANSAGHITDFATRNLSAGDISAAPATGSANYLQNQNASAQTASSWINGNMRANNFYGNAGIGTLQFGMLNGTSFRWGMLLSGAESANAGSNWTLLRYNDAGAMTTVMEANRLTGIVSMPYGFRGANSSGITGTGTTSNQALFSFYQSDGTTRDGFVGKAIGSNKDIYLQSDAGNVNIAPSSASSATFSPGQLSLINGTSNWVNFNSVGVAAPTFTTRSNGTKIVLYNAFNATNADHAIGVETSNTWFSVPSASSGWKWYAGTTQVSRLDGVGNLQINGSLTTQNVLSPASADLNIKGDLATRFFTGGTERVTISSAGILSVGNSTPDPLRSSPLQVQGNVWSTDAYLLGTGSVPLGEFGIGGSNIFIRTMSTNDILFQTSASTVRGRFSGTTGNLEVNNQIKISGGSPGAGKKLTSDANGLATWTSGVTQSIRTITASTTATADDYTIVNRATTGNPVITLPSASANTGKVYILIESAANSTANGMTFSAVEYNNTSYTNFTNPVFSSNKGITVQSDGSVWLVIGRM